MSPGSEIPFYLGIVDNDGGKRYYVKDLVYTLKGSHRLEGKECTECTVIKTITNFKL